LQAFLATHKRNPQYQHIASLAEFPLLEVLIERICAEPVIDRFADLRALVFLRKKGSKTVNVRASCMNAK
jgi:hypothetical protein